MITKSVKHTKMHTDTNTHMQSEDSNIKHMQKSQIYFSFISEGVSDIHIMLWTHSKLLLILIFSYISESIWKPQ